nr:serine O-acetyltransferase EpsC [Frankia sp. KB5]
MLSTLRHDLRTVKERDPAARSTLEIALCYPGVHAVWGHRISHWLWTRDLRLPGRVVATLTRMLTGVEIHPAATLGPGVFIDHATGVVIGETAEVGADVTIYHGVTLGGTSLEPTKRHPTIGDRIDVDLTIAAGVSDRGLVHRSNEDGFALAVVGPPGPAGPAYPADLPGPCRPAQWSLASPARSSPPAVPGRPPPCPVRTTCSPTSSASA